MTQILSNVASALNPSNILHEIEQGVQHLVPSADHLTQTAALQLTPVAGDVLPVIQDVGSAVVAGVSGNVLGATVSGVKAIEDTVRLAKDAAPLAGDVVQGISSAYHIAANAAAHVATSGMVALVEQELGALESNAKARLTSMLHGLVHAATLFRLP